MQELINQTQFRMAHPVVVREKTANGTEQFDLFSRLNPVTVA